MMVRCIVCNDIVEYDTTWTRTTYTTCTKCRLPVEKSERIGMVLQPEIFMHRTTPNEPIAKKPEKKIAEKGGQMTLFGKMVARKIARSA